MLSQNAAAGVAALVADQAADAQEDVATAASLSDAVTRLGTLVTLQPPYDSGDAMTLEQAVQALCRQADISCDLEQSRRNLGSSMDLQVRPDFAQKPLRVAIAELLAPHGCAYVVEGETLTVHVREPSARQEREDASANVLTSGPVPPPGGVSREFFEQAVQMARGRSVKEAAENVAMTVARHKLASQFPEFKERQQAILDAQRQMAQARAAAAEGTRVDARRVVFDVAPGQYERNVLKAPEGLAVVVDFWAPWCGPCRRLGPALERVVYSFGGRAVLAKVNIDEHREVANHYGIHAIPTVKVFRSGREVGGFRGAQPEDRVADTLTPLVYGEDLENYRQAEARLRIAEDDWNRLTADYSQELNRIYQEVYPTCLAAVQQVAQDSARRAQNAAIEEVKKVFKAGRYEWLRKGKPLGTVEFMPDGTVGAVPGGIGKGARWAITAEGLVVTDAGRRWLFTSGPAETMLGKCRSDDLAMDGQGALLRPVESDAD